MSVNGLQIALLGGLLFGAGFAGLLCRLLPAHADAAEVLDRLAPAAPRVRDDGEPASDALNDRLGRWAWKSLPAALLGRPPSPDLPCCGSRSAASTATRSSSPSSAW
jgi:hypothetical protein